MRRIIDILGKHIVGKRVLSFLKAKTIVIENIIVAIRTNEKKGGFLYEKKKKILR